MAFLYFFAITLFIIVCLLLTSVILMQESKSTGLGTSFGGDSRESLFGTGTADVLKKITAWLVVIFLGSCILLSLWTNVLGRSRASSAAFEIEQVE